MLALVAAVMLALAPALVDDPGFQLSFVGTAGILLLAAPIAQRLPGPRLFAEPFAVTVAAQIATVPVMAGTFGVVALGGPLANALVLPLLPLMIVSGGAGAILSALHAGDGLDPPAGDRGRHSGDHDHRRRDCEDSRCGSADRQLAGRMVVCRGGGVVRVADRACVLEPPTSSIEA